MWWVDNPKLPGALPRERPGTHYVGGWVDPRDGLDGCRKSCTPPGFDPRMSESAKYFEVQSSSANPMFGESSSFQPLLQLQTLTVRLPTTKTTNNNDMPLRMRAYIKIKILITEVYSFSFFYINN